MSVNLYKWQKQMCPIKSFWKENIVRFPLLLLLMIICIILGSQIFGHVLIANSWSRYCIAAADGELKERLWNVGPLWSILVWHGESGPSTLPKVCSCTKETIGCVPAMAPHWQGMAWQGLNDEKAAGTAKEKGQMWFAHENLLKRKMLGFSTHSQL